MKLFQENRVEKCCALLMFFALSVTASAAEDFDGTRPMECLPLHGHDCLPNAASCKVLKPEKGKNLNMQFDIAKKTVKTPYRSSLLPIESVGKNAESLVLQGTTLQLVWSATIHRTTGRLTIAIADREGAYVVFGQCKLATANALQGT